MLALLGVEVGARRHRQRREVADAAHAGRVDARVVEPPASEARGRVSVGDDRLQPLALQPLELTARQGRQRGIVDDVIGQAHDAAAVPSTGK